MNYMFSFFCIWPLVLVMCHRNFYAPFWDAYNILRKSDTFLCYFPKVVIEISEPTFGATVIFCENRILVWVIHKSGHRNF